VAAVGRRRGIKIRKAQTLSGPFSFQPHPALRATLSRWRGWVRRRRRTLPGGVRGGTLPRDHPVKAATISSLRASAWPPQDAVEESS
jgi:hypothetical protein